MSSKTAEEALAFVSHITQGKGGVHFEAVLGAGRVPAPTDFASDQEESLERVSEFLVLIEEYTSCLHALSDEAARRASERKKEEKAQYLPGLAPEDEDASAPRKSRSRKTR